MVWSQFFIVVQFGVHFGNSVRDNSNWDKTSHSLTKKVAPMWWRWGTSQKFLLAFIDELWKIQKIRLFRKWKNLLEISSFYTSVPKTTIIWGAVPEIQSKTEFFVILSHFCPFNLLPPNNPENQNFEEIKKAFGYVIALNLCNKNTIIWCMLTQIWSAHTDIIFCHYYFKKWKKTLGDIILLHMCTNNQVHMHPWYDVRFLRYEIQQTELFWIILKISKMRKNPGGVIILHKCNKNHDHLLYCSRDVTRDGCNCYLSFLAIFSPFTPLQPKKWKCQKNENKNALRYHHLTQVYQKNDLMLYWSWDTAHGKCNYYFSFSAIVCPFTPPNSPENANFKKPSNKKKHLEISF